MTDIPGDTSTTATLTVGSTTNGDLEVVGDHDWYKISLTAGQSITVTINGVTLEDPYLYIHNSGGAVIYEDDDINPGIIRDSQLSFTASYTGDYYIDVGAFAESYAGTYQVVVSNYTPPPLATVDDIADQLVSGYWAGDSHHFDVSQGGTITVNLTGLTAAGQTLARAALSEWSDVIGVTFQEVSTGGQIIFDDDQSGAFTDANWSGGITDWAHVNVGIDWLNAYGTGLGSYSFQTYIHEIGHALGLGHAGNYNDVATYPYDSLFENDAWSTSIMSYFSQFDNTYFQGQGFSEDFAVTPMMADIVAMQQLYGLSTITRTGDTTYGFNSNADRSIYHADLYPNVAYTIFDSGGTDTLDFSGFNGAQRIDLNPETFSNVVGNTGNVSIGRGVVIENATGGGGADTIIGNSANNVLNGGAGVDTVSFESAASGVTANLALATAQNTGGAGTDTLLNFENLTGSSFNDVLTGNAGANVLDGGLGNDTLNGGSGADTLIGGDGNDLYVVDNAGDVVTENPGEGSDTVKSSITWTLGATFENLTLSGSGSTNGTGNALANALRGNDSANVLDGQAGDDYLFGYGGNDTLTGGTGIDRMYGGLGDDTYYVNDTTDFAYEDPSAGYDTVIASLTYVMRENLEELQLSGSADIRGYGNYGDNLIIGNSGGNLLYGREGNDTLVGGAGYDKMYGGVGDDTYIVNDANDYANEYVGEGNDRVIASLTVTLRANIEELELAEGAGDIRGYGNALDNLIIGNSGANLLYGRDGNDSLFGNAGNDQLHGENGNDSLDAGAGQDRFYGGAGADAFLFKDGDFAGMTSSNSDRILDFSQAEGDTIDLSGVDANSLLGGDQGFAFVGTAAFSHTAGELRYFQSGGTTTYIEGDTNGDGIADFLIRIDGLHNLQGADLVL